MHFSTISLAFNPSLSSIPSINPIPSTLFTLSNFFRLSFIYFPFLVISLRKFLSKVLRISKAPEQITGLAPKVEAWSPAVKVSEHFLFMSIAPIGSPPPKPFAKVIISAFKL